MIGTVIVGALSFAGWLASQPPEPSYKGRRVSEYLDELAKTIATNQNPTAGSVYVEIKYDDARVRAMFESGPEAIPYLRRAIRRRGSVRVKATEFLRAKLPGTFGKWLRAPDYAYMEGVNEACFRGLAAFGPEARSALPEILACFEELPSRNMAFYAALQIGPRLEDAPRLVELLSNSKDSGVRCYAAVFLGKLGTANKDVTAALTRACRDQAQFVQRGAVVALGEIGPPARAVAEPVLVGLLTNSSHQVRISALLALASIKGETNVVVLQKELESAVQQLGSDSQPRIADLSDNDLCLMLLAQSLSGLGEEAAPALSVLRPLVQNNDVRVAWNATRAVWRIGRETNGVISICNRLLADRDPNLRLVGAELLAEVCAGARIPLPDESTLLSAPDRFVRFYAARADWKLTGETERTLPLITEGLEDHFTYYRNAEIRKLAAETLAEMGTNAHAAIPSVKRALRDGEESVRKAATNALRQIDPSNAPR